MGTLLSDYFDFAGVKLVVATSHEHTLGSEAQNGKHDVVYLLPESDMTFNDRVHHDCLIGSKRYLKINGVGVNL